MTPTSNSLDFQPDQWVKGKMIGSGSFGSVHMAMDKSNGRLFVVKSSQSTIGLKPLENEANILMNLESPYVVRYLGKEVTQEAHGEKILNVFMEHMGGGSLSNLADKFEGLLFEGAIRSYTREILKGLNHLHENGIVHCDIKCKNILLDSCGNLKLADFGCSHKVDDSEEPNKSLDFLQRKQSIEGTPLWMAPELLKGGRLSFAIDIWSLGCSIIEMATGRPPCWGTIMSHPMVMVMKIALSDEKPQFPKNMSKEGLDFLERCLERDPNKRWTAKELLHHPFVSNNEEMNMNMMKEIDASSPSSIFDIGYSDYDYEMDSSDEDEPWSPRRVLGSMEYHVDEKGMKSSSLEVKTNLETSGDWLTVRSV